MTAANRPTLSRFEQERADVTPAASPGVARTRPTCSRLEHHRAIEQARALALKVKTDPLATLGDAEKLAELVLTLWGPR